MIQYMAGIFDSEGYVRIRRTGEKTKTYTPELKLYMTNKEIIDIFASRYGLTVKQDNRGRYRKLAYHVTFGVHVLKNTSFLKDIYPYLNEKREQVKQVINLLQGSMPKETCYQEYIRTKTVFTHPINGVLSPEYLAGIIDGDGWLSMFNAGKSRALYNNFSVGLQQRYRPMIEYMTRFGGGSVHTCKVYDYNSHIQTYSWQCTTAETLPLLEAIVPYLIEKKQKCLILINYINECEKFRKYSQETLAKW